MSSVSARSGVRPPLNSGFTVTGGQMWSLVTETKKSTDNRTENLPHGHRRSVPVVGFSWERQPGVRFQQKLGGFTAAVSAEQAEYVYSASNANNNFFIGNAGTGGGLYNVSTNYSNNVAPDVIVKFTYDAKVGHFEAGGLGRWFRDRYYPNQTLTVPSLLVRPTTPRSAAASSPTPASPSRTLLTSACTSSGAPA